MAHYVAIKYLDENVGQKVTEEYLLEIGKICFATLTKKLKKDGLKALEDHWQCIFQKEQGVFRLYYETNKLCYCETNVVVNKVICNQAGYQFTVNINPIWANVFRSFGKNSVGRQ